MQIQIEVEVQIDFKSDSFDTKIETEGQRDSGWRGGGKGRSDREMERCHRDIFKDKDRDEDVEWT